MACSCVDSIPSTYWPFSDTRCTTFSIQCTHLAILIPPKRIAQRGFKTPTHTLPKVKTGSRWTVHRFRCSYYPSSPFPYIEMCTFCVTCGPCLPIIKTGIISVVSTILHGTVCGVIVDGYNTAAVNTGSTFCVGHCYPLIVVTTLPRVASAAVARLENPAGWTGCNILPACHLNWQQTMIRFMTIQHIYGFTIKGNIMRCIV